MVLDATAFYADVPFTSPATYYTTDSVVREVSHGTIRAGYIEGLVEAGRLRIRRPSERYVEWVRKAAGGSGDFSHLSDTDVSVVALALELRSRGLSVTVVSDDYSVENLAHILGFKVVSVMTSGIKRVVQWLIYCGGCGKIFQDGGVRVCDVCGSPLRRRFKTANDLSRDE